MTIRYRLHDAVERTRSSLWVTPTLSVLFAVLLLIVLLQVDERTTVHGLLRFGGEPLEAREVASTIAGAMLSFIAIVFSVTIVALQLASSQFSPRVLRTFLRDRVTKATLGAFVGTFVYALMLVKFLDASLERVPDLTVDAMFVLAFVCVAMFIVYIHRIAQSIRVVTILEAVASETRHAIERLLPEPSDQTPVTSGSHSAAGVRLESHRVGIVTAIDRDALVSLAAAHDCTIEVLPSVGDFVRSGAALVLIHGGTPPPRPKDVEDAFQFGIERTMQFDIEFGFRQLVDIAERALSPGINDPTTAIQAIDQLHDLLGRIASRPQPATWHPDDGGTPRVSLPVRTWEDYVELAVDPIRGAGGGTVQVHRRLRTMLHELSASVPVGRQEALRARLGHLDQVAEREFALPVDQASARSSDDRGQ